MTESSKIRYYTKEEDMYLHETSGKYSTAAQAAHLGRTPQSIRSRMFRLGIQAKNQGYEITLTDLAKTLKVNKSRLIYWMKAYNLPTSKRGKFRKVNPDKFWEWATEHQHLYGWHQLSKNALPIEPDWVEPLRLIDQKNKKVGLIRPWNEWEDSVLEEGIQEGFTKEHIALKLNRTPNSVSKRRTYLMIKQPFAPSINRRLSNSDKQLVHELIKEGVPFEEISRRTGVKNYTISYQAKKLRES